MTVTALATAPPDLDTASSFVERQLRIGLEYYAAGKIDQAAITFERGLAAADNIPNGRISIEAIADLHSRLGNACMVRGDLDRAAANYRSALQLVPHLTSCWCNLGNVCVKTGKPQQAIALYLHALRLNPGHWPSRSNLVEAVMATRQYLVAKALLAEMVAERPQDGQLRHQLGKVHHELNEPESAIEYFQQAVALHPRDADSIYWIGGIRQRMGDIAAAQAAYADAARIQPLIRRPAATFPAEFRVLALFAPFGGNTPTEYLFKDAVYDTATLAIFAAGEYDVEPLSREIEVVVNLISDADQSESVLPLAADLAGRLGKPIINDPGWIRRTTRDAVAELLQGIPGCRVPKVLRQKAGVALAEATLQAAFPAASTVLARPVGTHGGDDFEKLEGHAGLAAFFSQRPDIDHYLIEYIDYRSVDGHFRKYRFIFVDGQMLPYHLAISRDWKVHHDNTDMVDHAWMQSEEQAFLNDPAAVFNAGHYQALREIERRVGLEYFGIDCGLDRSGNMVVFEANASMLVHEQNQQFPYKAPFVLRIKSAFDAMLCKRALAGG